MSDDKVCRSLENGEVLYPKQNVTYILAHWGSRHGFSSGNDELMLLMRLMSMLMKVVLQAGRGGRGGGFPLSHDCGTQAGFPFPANNRIRFFHFNAKSLLADYQISSTTAYFLYV